MSSRPPTPPTKLPKGEEQRRFKHIGLPIEWVEQYRPGGLHPVNLGDTFNHGRYKVIRKLGNGSFATVWLAIDRKEPRAVALKIGTASACETMNEVSIYEKIYDCSNDFHVNEKIVKLIDVFQHQGPNGQHRCLVFEAMGPSVSYVMDDLPATLRSNGPNRLPVWAAKRLFKQMLKSLVVIHSLGYIHGDLNCGNLLFALRYASSHVTGEALEESLRQKLDESNHELVERKDGLKDPWAPDYLIAGSTLIDQVDFNTNFRIKLSDFGGSFPSTKPPLQTTTPTGLRAPEIVLGLQITQAIDIWSFGCLMYELLTGEVLFPILDLAIIPREEIEDEQMLRFTYTLGPLPSAIRNEWKRYHRYFDENGKQTEEEEGEEYESLEERFSKERPSDIGESESADILALIRSILAVDARSRPSAQEIIQHPWFKAIDTEN